MKIKPTINEEQGNSVEKELGLPMFRKLATRLYVYGLLLGLAYTGALVYAKRTHSMGYLLFTETGKKVPLVALQLMMITALIVLVLKIILTRTEDSIPNTVNHKYFVIFKYMVLLVSLMAGTTIPLILCVAILASSI